ncbi:MAG: hypothetical protein GY913_10070 [Proteobacteria bacterium]|nr:hypothetical protein [Pseudomonadota bacterium]MCP4917259.1 hypothetical protein [Pseudomonadota bacterium]
MARGLCRFELKPALASHVARDERRIEAAEKAWSEGRYLGGYHASQLQKAAREAERAGRSVAEAVAQRIEKLRQQPHDQNKKDLRLWAPAHYVPDSRRESANVLSLSCLVLDYDDGTPFPEARHAWASWYHIVHTTWSHRPQHHKFRLCLPLAAPVFATDWERVWSWGAAHAGGHVDPAPSSPGSTFALPAVASVGQARVAVVNPGPLLDVRAVGLIQHAAPAGPDVGVASDSHFAERGAPDKRYVVEDPGPVDTRPWDVDGAFDELF